MIENLENELNPFAACLIKNVLKLTKNKFISSVNTYCIKVYTCKN